MPGRPGKCTTAAETFAWLAPRRPDRLLKNFRMLGVTKILSQFFLADSPIRPVSRQFRQRAARANHRIEKPPGRHPIPKFEPVRDQAVDTQVFSQRPHDVVEPLADQNDPLAATHRLLQFRDAVRLQPRLEYVFEIFLAEQLQPVAADASQHGMQQPRSAHSVGRIEHRPGHGQHSHRAAPRPAFEKALGIPGEKSHWAHRREVQ